MKRIVLGLIVVALVGYSASPAMAHGHHSHGPRVGFYGGYGPVYRPYWAAYPRPYAHYPAVPVYPVYPAYPAYPRAGFSYFGPGFSFSFGR